MLLKQLKNWLTPAESGAVIGISKQAVVKRLENSTIRGVKTHQGWLVDPIDTERVKQERDGKG